MWVFYQWKMMLKPWWKYDISALCSQKQRYDVFIFSVDIKTQAYCISYSPCPPHTSEFGLLNLNGMEANLMLMSLNEKQENESGKQEKSDLSQKIVKDEYKYKL